MASGGPRRRSARADRAAALLDGGRPPRDEYEQQLARTISTLRALPVPAMSPSTRAETRAMLLARLSIAGLTDAAAGPAGTTGPISVPEPVSATSPTGAPGPVDAAADAADAAGTADTAGTAGTGGTGAAPAHRATIVTRPDRAHLRRAVRSARPALVGALAASVAAVGVAVSSTDALPGEFLYGVKRHVEQLQVSLAASRVERAKAQLAVARTRMNELTAVLGQATSATGDAAVDAGTHTGSGHGDAGRPGSTGDPVAAAEPDPRARPGAGEAGLSPAPGEQWPAGAPAAQAPAGSPAGRPGAHTGAAGAGGAPTAGGQTAAMPPTAHATAGGGSVRARDLTTAAALLHDWCTDAAAGSEVLIEEIRSGNTDAWKTLNEFNTDQSTRLDALLGVLGSSAGPDATEARRIIRDVGSVLTFTSAHSGGPSTPVGSGSGSALGPGTATAGDGNSSAGTATANPGPAPRPPRASTVGPPQSQAATQPAQTSPEAPAIDAAASGIAPSLPLPAPPSSSAADAGADARTRADAGADAGAGAGAAGAEASSVSEPAAQPSTDPVTPQSATATPQASAGLDATAWAGALETAGLLDASRDLVSYVGVGFGVSSDPDAGSTAAAADGTAQAASPQSVASDGAAARAGGNMAGDIVAGSAEPAPATEPVPATESGTTVLGATTSSADAPGQTQATPAE
ncbi:DUF5667 domain-containing protein [Parafrankia irregularis]|uniref:DUF5667 domain-containing protein n=1 Tax=Parafrankia irregularis TaxID=795642 RepID=UPI0010422161|nr:DUF5667 domain-containing protein [Parafrankia irregularis]